MELNKFVEGLSIFSRYYDDPSGFHLGADHDIIYIYAPNKHITDGDLLRLRELGFFQPDVDGEDEQLATYAPEEGWATYV